MADITMCEGTNCPLKDSCYRYKAIADKIYQSYFIEVPFKDNKCDNYWEIKDYKIINN